MSIIYHDGEWGLSEKAKEDRKRHNEKVDKAIRSAAKDIIADEPIISGSGDKTVRVPIRGLKEWRFIHGRNGNVGGAGQGKGKPGDVIYSKNKGTKGKAGNMPGDDIIEVDVDLKYLIEIMFDELGLPFLKDKDKVHKYVVSGFKFESISKKGIYPQLHKKRTYAESIKRFAGDIREILDATNCDEDSAKAAYVQSNYDISSAIDLINSNEVSHSDSDQVEVIINDEDLRFKKIDDNLVPQSQAVVFLLCDSSGSMDTEKKYLMRALFFWYVQFLKTCYETIDIRFITHDTNAKLVTEEEFFKKGESGGTMPSTAFDLTTYLIDTEYPLNEWNVYVGYVSDGETWDIQHDVLSLKALLEKNINMFSYFEIHPETSVLWGYAENYLLDAFVKYFKLKKTKVEEGKEFYKNEEKKFYAGIITNKDDVWPALKFTLFGKRQ